MPDEISDQQNESLKRMFKNHPNAAARAHRAFLSGISDEAQAYLYKHDVPHLAYHADMEAIRNRPKNEHLAAVKELHMREASAPDSDGQQPHENTMNDLMLGPKAERSPAHRHAPVRGYR